jgi:hypothetical protein
VTEKGHHQPSSIHPGELPESADTVEKLGSASDAKIHEEFLSILRATCSLG